jgi:heptosyltransferase-1
MRVLIVKISSMGDVIHTLPALTDAGIMVKGISFDWVVEENFAEIPGWHKLVNKVIPIALRRWRKHPIKMLTSREWQSFRNNLKSKLYDFIIDAQGLIKSAVIAKMANGAVYGMDKHSAKEPFATHFYQHKFSIPKQQHAITRIRQLFAKALNYSMPNTAPVYGLNIANNREDYLVFLHGTSRKEKLWPEQNWLALAKLAAKYPIKIPWSNDEEYKRAKRIAEQCENVQILAKMNLTEIANILSKAKAVVAVDTGLGHLAAALDAPTISLYGPDPKLIGTYGKYTKHLITRTSGIVDISVSEVKNYFSDLSICS